MRLVFGFLLRFPAGWVKTGTRRYNCVGLPVDDDVLPIVRILGVDEIGHRIHGQALQSYAAAAGDGNIGNHFVQCCPSMHHDGAGCRIKCTHETP